MKKIGFIGTGIMGAAMAGHLMDAGYELSVYNRTKAKAQALLDRGARWCDTPGACAQGQDVVITIVGYPKDVEEVYLGEQGVVANAKAGACLIDMTTSSPALAERIYKAAAAKGIHALDAPVTGGDTGAKAGTLTILVGGDWEDFDALMPVFSAMGKNIQYMGAASAGQKTKLCNQIAIAGALAGACEALAYGRAAGLDVEHVRETIGSGAAGSFQMNNVVKRALEGDFAPGFMLKHFIKDMKLGEEAAEGSALTLPVLAQVREECERLVGEGCQDNGTQALMKYYGG